MDVSRIYKVGSEVGPYRIEELLGRGGMGVVYRATDLKLGRPVALKLLPPETAGDERFRARFERESRLAASIDHAGIIPVYDAGDVDGLMYIAMRFVDGRDLGALLKREGPFEPGRALALVEQLAEALDAAHERGLVHRDVKPSNALVARQGTREHVYLADFGLTKTSGPSASTASGELLGTASYLAPEVIRGGEVSAASDLYALGCVLYECLTGEIPFSGPNPAAVIYGHLESPVPRVSERGSRLPRALDAVIARALAKEPSARYGSGAEMVDAARAALGLPPAQRRPARRPRRPRSRAYVAGAVLLALCLAAIAATLARDDATPGGGAPEPLPASFCSPAIHAGGTQPRYVIASYLDLEGDAGVLGNQISAAVEFVMRENRFAAGRRAVAYQACDSSGEDDTVEVGCLSKSRKLSANPGLLGVIGPLGSVCAEAIIPRFNAAAPGPLALISPSATRVGLTRPGLGAAADEPDRFYPTGVRNFVRVIAADDFQIAANAMMAKKLGVNRAFLLSDGPENSALREGFSNVAGKIGLRVVGEDDWRSTSDYRALARRIGRERADGVFLAGQLGSDGAKVIRALRAELGPGVRLLALDGFSVPELVPQTGRASEGMRISVPGVDPATLDGAPGRLVDRLREAIGEPHAYAVSAAQATQMLLDAIGRSDGTRSSVVGELFAGDVRGGLLGDFSVLPSGDTTANRVTIYRIVGGERRVERVITPPLSLVVRG